MIFFFRKTSAALTCDNYDTHEKHLNDLIKENWYSNILYTIIYTIFLSKSFWFDASTLFYLMHSCFNHFLINVVISYNSWTIWNLWIKFKNF